MKTIQCIGVVIATMGLVACQTIPTKTAASNKQPRPAYKPSVSKPVSTPRPQTVSTQSGYVRSAIDKMRFELNYTSTEKGKLKTNARDADRYFASWTKNTGKFPLQMVSIGGKKYVRGNIKGKMYELSWTKIAGKSLGYGRLYAVWTQNLGKNPVTEVYKPGRQVSLRMNIEGRAYELNWGSNFADGKPDKAYGRKAVLWNPSVNKHIVNFSAK